MQRICWALLLLLLLLLQLALQAKRVAVLGIKTEEKVSSQYTKGTQVAVAAAAT
jgi:hypothetical protein